MSSKKKKKKKKIRMTFFEQMVSVLFVFMKMHHSIFP